MRVMLWAWASEFMSVMGIDGQGDVVPVLVRLARGRLDPDAGGDPGDHQLGDAQLLQVSSRLVLVNAPHVRLVTVWSFGC